MLLHSPRSRTRRPSGSFWSSLFAALCRGRHRRRARGYAEASIALVAEELEDRTLLSGTPIDATALVLSQVGSASVAGEIEVVDEVDFYSYTAPASGFGATFQVTVRLDAAPGSSLDPFLAVFDSAEDEIASNDDIDLFDLNSQVQFLATAGETYFIRAGAFAGAFSGDDTGAYQLTVSPVIGNNFNTAQPITFSISETLVLPGILDDFNDADFFVFEASFTGQLTVRMEKAPGSSVDSVLTAFDANETQLAHNDAIDLLGGNLDAEIQFAVIAGQTYFVSATGFAGDRGAYVLSFIPPGPMTIVGLDEGNLIIEDVDPAGKDDRLTISFDSNTNSIVIHDPDNELAAGTGAFQVNPNTISILLTSVTGQLIINGGGGDDTLTIDFSGGNPIPIGGLLFDGGAGFDTLNIIGGGTFDTTTFTYVNANDGSIVLDDGTTLSTISYVGLEPITSDIQSDVVELIFTGDNETITVTDVGGGQTNVNSTLGETTTFANPTDELRIIATNGTDVINVDSLASGYASLVISGDDEADVVNINGPLTFAAGHGLTVFDVGTLNLPNATSDIVTSGSGAVSITALKNIALASGSSITTADGDITLLANWQTATAGNFIGINVNNASIGSTSGDITLRGRGGNDAVGFQFGVRILNAAVVGLGTTGIVTIEGEGGSGTGPGNGGVVIGNSGSRITSGGGNVSVTGSGGAGASFGNTGVEMFSAGEITAGGSGTVTVVGNGGNPAGGSTNGVLIRNLGSRITSDGGNISVTGTGGGLLLSRGITVADFGQIVGTSGTLTVTLTADSMELLSTTSIDAGSNTVVLRPKTAGTRIHLGGANVLTGTPLTLGLTNAELNRIVAGTLIVGSAASGEISVTESISLTNVDTLQLHTGAAIASSVAGDISVDTLNAFAATGIGLNTDTTSLSAILSGNGTIALTEAGTTSVTSLIAGNGTVHLNDGTFNLAADNVIAGTTSVHVNGATLGLGTFSDIVAGLTLTGGSITGTTGLLTSTGTFDVRNGTISARLGGNVGLTKSTAGTVTLSGDSTYTGTTTVTDGTLLVEGALASATLAVTGGTLLANANLPGSNVSLTGGTLGGTGTVGGINATGGAVSPGSSTAILIAAGNVALNSDTTFVVELDGTTAGNDYDQLAVSGLVTLGNAVLDVTAGFAADVDDFFTIVTSTGGIVGTFAGLPGGATFIADGQAFEISYLPNNVVLTRVSTAVYVDGSGNLVIEDVDGVNNALTISLNPAGTHVIVSDPNTNNGLNTQVDLALITGKIIVSVGDGDDTLTLDYSNGLLPDVEFDGGAGDDALAVTGGGTFQTHTTTFTYVNASDGSIHLDLDGSGTTVGTISYVGLEPITSDIQSDVVELIFTGGDETITVTDAGGGETTVNSTLGEITTFVNPTAELRIIATNGTDTIDVDSLASGYASLVISGDDAADVVNINGPLTFAAGHGLTVFDVGTVNLLNVNSDITASGSGSVNITALKNIALASGSSITTVNGNVTLSANQQATATGGNFIGIDVDGATIASTGSGNISLTGRGGDTGIENHGVRFADGGKIEPTGSGTVTVTGFGGASTSNENFGVWVGGTDSLITSGGGHVSVTGTGGGAGSSASNFGVWVQSGQITAGGSGTVTVAGQGGNTAGTGGTFNFGVWVLGNTARITSGGGNVSVTGTGGGAGDSGFNYGVFVEQGRITAGGFGTVSVAGQGGNTAGTGGSNYGVHVIGNTARITSNNGNVSVTGTGGGGGSSGFNFGVFVFNQGQITAGGSGTVTVVGQGGNTTGTGGVNNYGVRVSGTDSLITSGGGNVSVSGTGGGAGDSSGNYGVFVDQGQITAGGFGTVSVAGQGGNTTGTGGTFNFGVRVTGNTARITSTGGNVSVTGTGGGAGDSSGNYGVFVDQGQITAGDFGTVTVAGQGGNTAGTAGNNNYGVHVTGTDARITSAFGNVSVTGTGGGAGSSGGNTGVLVESAGQITAGGSSGIFGTVTVVGQGGNTTGTAGDGNHGVFVSNNNNQTSQITSGGGNVSVTGTGGGAGGSFINHGVFVSATDGVAQITAGGSGTVTVTGQGGNTTGTWGGDNYGVQVSGNNARITSNNGNVSVTGTGGGAGSSDFNYGVSVQTGQITAGGFGTVTVVGQGGNTAGTAGDGNYGVRVVGTTARIVSNNGHVSVTGTGGGGGDSGDNIGVVVEFAGQITAGGFGTVTVAGQGGNTTGTGGDTNYGVWVVGTDSLITSDGGNVSVTGTGGGAGSSGSNFGVLLESGGQIAAGGSGTVTVVGEGGSSSGDFNVGVYLFDTDSRITSGGGDVEVTGTGGGTGSSEFNIGVYLESGGQISAGGTGTVTVVGYGGDTEGDQNRGVVVFQGDANRGDSRITSDGGDVSVTGFGGGTGSSDLNFGVWVLVNQFGDTAEISAGGTGTVTVEGYGGNTTGSGDENRGVVVFGTNARITSNGGNVFVTGTAGGGPSSHGIRVRDNGRVVGTSGTPTVTLTADSMALDSTTSIDAGNNTVVLRQKTAGTLINLGGADVLTGSPLTLGLTNAELNRIIASQLVIGDPANTGNIIVSQNVSAPNVDTLWLRTAGAIVHTAGTLTVTNLALDAATGIADAGALQVAVGNNLAFQNTTSGDVNITGADNLAIAAVADLTESFNAAGGGTIQAAANRQVFIDTRVSLIDGTFLPEVLVRAGGTLAGTGTVGVLTVDTGGTVSPGFSPGILNTGDLAFKDNSTYVVEIGGTTPGDHDQLVVTGEVFIDPFAGLSVSSFGGFVPSAGDVFIIIANDDNDPVLGEFINLSEGTVIDTDFLGSGLTARITYAGGDGNDVALVVDGPVVFEGTSGDDEFVITRVVDGLVDVIQVSLGGVVIDSRPTAGLESLTINGGAGNDTLTIDTSGGLITLPGGIRFDGGSGFDQVWLVQTGGPQHDSSTLYVGAAPGTGQSVIVGAGGVGQQTLYFENIEPIIDLLPAAELHIAALPGFASLLNADNAINYTQSALDNDWGQVTVDSFEPVHFANKEKLLIDAGPGSDTIHLNNPTTPTGLTEIEIIGGDPTAGSDTLIVNGTTLSDTVVFEPTAADAATIIGAGPVPITAGGIEHLIYNGQGGDDSLTIMGTSGNETFVHTPGATIDAGTVRRNSTLAMTYQNIGAGGTLTIDGDDGDDTLVVQGTAADDVFTVGDDGTNGTVQLNNRIGLLTDSIEQLTLLGFDGNDTFTVNATDEFESVAVQGGDPSASDVLNLIGTGGDDTIDVNLATATVTGIGPDVSFTGVEIVNIDGGGGADDTLTVNGTLLDDRIIYRPTGPQAGTFRLDGTNTVFNFLQIAGAFTINGGDDVADEVVVEGTNGRDLITIDSPNRTVTVRNAALVNLKPVVLGNTVEILSVQGRLGNDTFLVIPAAGVAGLPLDNLIIHIDGGPGTTTDALVIAADAVGTGLDNDTHFVVVGKSLVPNAGFVRVFEADAGGPTQYPDIFYANVEIVEPLFDNVDPATGEPNLLILGPDQYESNNTRATAAFIGSGATINVTNLTIFPNNAEFPFVPADQDWFRFVAAETGTLDFQIYFRQFDPDLLPGGGDLRIAVYDAAGNLIENGDGDPAESNSSQFPGGNERVTVPVVRNQTYYLQVVGAVGGAINGYDMTVINVPAPVPQLVDLTAATDSGRNDNDDVTNFDADDNDPAVFHIVLDDARLQEFDNLQLIRDTDYGVRVFNNGAAIGDAVYLADSTWQFTASANDLIEGHNNFLSAAVWIRDGAGVIGRGELSNPLQITLDVTPPPPPTIALKAGSDSGLPSNPPTIVDNVTSNTLPVFVGVAEANSIVRVYAELNGDPDGVFLGMAVALPFDGNEAYVDEDGNPLGQWTLQTNIDLNDPVFGQLDGLRTIRTTAEDLAGNISDIEDAVPLLIFIDTQGPQVFAPAGEQPIQVIEVTNLTTGDETVHTDFDLFNVKPGDGPTPPVYGLRVNIQDGPDRVAGFLFDAIDAGLASQPGHYLLVGDHVGIVSIDAIVVTLNPVVAGEPATATIDLRFNVPLPDDRYTLTILDTLLDPAGNRLDGESNAAEPSGAPGFPSGNGISGGEFVARFTVDSRPELGFFTQAGVFIDANGNFILDPAISGVVNSDLQFQFGIQTDFLFAGQFNAAGPGANDGFDRMGAYGKINGQFRWLLDFDNDGVPDYNQVSLLQLNGLPIAGNFAPGIAGDQIGLFTGTTWYFDTNGDNNIGAGDLVLNGNLRGLPIIGDFDGDGLVDLATYSPTANTFYFSLSSQGGSIAGGNANATHTIAFGFPGVLERPFAADFNLDGITDIGLTTPHQGGTGQLEWYILLSDPNVGLADHPGLTAAEEGLLKFNTLNHPFSPQPLGRDIYSSFGPAGAIPIVGNFDPPVANPSAPPTEPTPPPSTTSAPVLAIGDYVIPHDFGALVIDLPEFDPDGDPVSYTVQLLAVDRVEELAYQLDQQLGLQFTGNYLTDWAGLGEKWLSSDSGTWYFITTDGNLHQWTGVRPGAHFLANSPLVESLDASFHADPSKLHDAQPPAVGLGGGNGIAAIHGSQLVVIPNTGFVGDVQVRVTATDGLLTTIETFQVTVINTPPVLAIGDRAVSHRHGPLAIELPEFDADGDLLSYTAELLAVDPLQELAWQLDQQLGLQFTGNYSTNWAGLGEKWLRSESGTWYFITPDGSLHQWTGVRPGANFLANSPLVASLDAGFHADPSRLHNAAAPAPLGAGSATVSVVDGTLTVTPEAGFAGDLQVRLEATDGSAVVIETFTVSFTNQAPVLDIGDQTLSQDGSLTLVLPESDPDGDLVTYTAEQLLVDPLLQLAWQLKEQLGLRFTGDYSTNWAGLGEKWLQSDSGTWYFILPDGSLHQWTGVRPGASFLANSPLVAGLDDGFHADPSRLYDATQPTEDAAAGDVTVSVSANVLTITSSAGFLGELRVRVTARDGLTVVKETLVVTVTEPAVSPFGDWEDDPQEFDEEDRDALFGSEDWSLFDDPVLNG